MRLSSGRESIANHLSRQSTVRSRETERYFELSPYGRVRIVCDSMCGIMHKIKRTLQLLYLPVYLHTALPHRQSVASPWRRDITAERVALGSIPRGPAQRGAPGPLASCGFYQPSASPFRVSRHKLGRHQTCAFNQRRAEEPGAAVVPSFEILQRPRSGSKPWVGRNRR